MNNHHRGPSRMPNACGSPNPVKCQPHGLDLPLEGRWQDRLLRPGKWLIDCEPAFLSAALLVGFLVRLWAMLQIEIISRDGFYYCVVARKIQDGHWLSATQGWFIFNPYPPLIACIASISGWTVEQAGQLMCLIPSALGIVPLYLWVKRAFRKDVALLSTLIYVFHPILIRNSGEVMREGLYWFLMLTAILFLWEGSEHRSLWKSSIGGILGTAAMLTRIEGAALFPLVCLWCFAKSVTVDMNWRARLRSAKPGIIACGMLPFVIVLLNLTLIPTGTPWQGIGRLEHLAQVFLEKTHLAPPVERTNLELAEKVAPPANPTIIRLASTASDTAIVDGEQTPTIAPAAAIIPHTTRTARVAPRNIRELAKSLPVWGENNAADPDWYRLQRFLVMADDQEEAIYIGVFLNRLIQGLLIPLLIWFGIGLSYGRDEFWQGTRDWPLMLQSVLLVTVFFFHLMTEHVLEARYLFCLIPFVFPWASIGILKMLDLLRSFLVNRQRSWQFEPIVATLFLLFSTGSLMHAMPRSDTEKSIQKQIGQEIQHLAGSGQRMVAPESLKRLAYYADAQFVIFPHQVAAIGPWLESKPTDFVVLGGKELSFYTHLVTQMDNHPDFERILTDNPRYQRYSIYRCRTPQNTRTKPLVDPH